MRLSRLAVLLPALFAAQLSLAQPSTNAPTTTVDNRTIISLAADAYREVQQDRVILSLSKEMRGPDAKVLADEVNKAINAVLEAGKGNDKLNLKTGSYNLWSQQEYDDSGKPTGKAIYVVTGEVIVSTEAMAEATSFIGQVSDHMNLSNINFEMTLETRRKVEDEIRAEAIQTFQQKARAVSREFGFDNYDIKYVQLHDSSVNNAPTPRFRGAKAEAVRSMDFAGPELSAGKERVSITLTGEIALY